MPGSRIARCGFIMLAAFVLAAPLDMVSGHLAHAQSVLAQSVPAQSVPAQSVPAGPLAAGPDATSPDNANPDTAPDEPTRDNPGSDDADNGANDDPVWGYFLGKSSYIFFHELARAIAASDGLQSRADSAAKIDQLTALLIITEGRKHFGGTVLEDAVAGWVVSWRQGQQGDQQDGANATAAGAPSSGEQVDADAAKADSWESANLSVHQMSDLICALYGSDPQHFHTLIDSGDIRPETTELCISGYRKLTEQWQALLQQAGIRLAGGGTASSASIILEQRPANAPELMDFTGWLHDIALGDNLAAELNHDLALATPLRVVLLQCGKTAAPQQEKGAAPICYEWLKTVYDAATAQNVEAPPE